MSQSKGRGDEAYVKILNEFTYFIATFDGNQYMERQSHFTRVKVRFQFTLLLYNMPHYPPFVNKLLSSQQCWSLLRNSFTKEDHRTSTADGSSQEIQKQMKQIQSKRNAHYLQTFSCLKSFSLLRERYDNDV